MQACGHCNQPTENKKYCSSVCVVSATHEKDYEAYILRWKNGEEPGDRGGEGTVSKHIRRYLFEKYDSKCCECGWARTNLVTGKIPLDIEHIDGNWSNNVEENLKLLCPNCHSITPTYKVLNRGKGRNRKH